MLFNDRKDLQLLYIVLIYREQNPRPDISRPSDPFAEIRFQSMKLEKFSTFKSALQSLHYADFLLTSSLSLVGEISSPSNMM